MTGSSKTALWAAGLLFARATLALAADSQGNFAVDGRGSVTCEQFVADLDDPTARTAYANYAAGFLTGVNIFTDDTFDITPWHPPTLVVRQLQTYCRANSAVTLIDALGRLTTFLRPGRLAQQSERIQIRHNGLAVVAYADVLERVAEALFTAGFADTPNLFDAPDAFADALTAYQTDMGLTQTGLPDIPTLLQLLQ